MGGLQEWKKRAIQPPAEKGAGLEQTVRKQLAPAAGAEYFDNRDPVRHITEDFQKTFDLMGNQKAKARSGELFQTEMPSSSPACGRRNGRAASRPPARKARARQARAGRWPNSGAGKAF